MFMLMEETLEIFPIVGTRTKKFTIIIVLNTDLG